MTAREFMEACNMFMQFGKIKDIDFDSELYNEPLNENNDDAVIRSFDFEDGYVTLGILESWGCDCCGYYYEETTYSLDELTCTGRLEKIIDMLDGVLKEKTGI
jgi:hypothetical protein